MRPLTSGPKASYLVPSTRVLVIDTRYQGPISCSASDFAGCAEAVPGVAKNAMTASQAARIVFQRLLLFISIFLRRITWSTTPPALASFPRVQERRVTRLAAESPRGRTLRA